MKPKIMFINAARTEVSFPPLGLGYLVSSLREKFGRDYIEFKIIDQNVEQEINGFKPDIVGITSISSNYSRAMGYARIAKEHSLPVIVGGVHISTLPSALTNDMSVGVIGEGEETIIELFNLFEQKGHFDKNELENIDGIVFRRNGELIVTKKRNLIEPLDRIPMPARDLFKIKKTAHMLTSRGCPYRCVFCSSSRFMGKFRYFSAEYVIAEMEHLIKEYHAEDIEFSDDLFIADKERVRQILELLKKKNIPAKVSSCYARANLIDDDIAYLLKQMGVRTVCLGLESGSPATLEYLKGRSVTVKDNMDAVRTLKKHGMNPECGFIIGSPQESRNEILQTLRFIKEAKITRPTIFVLTPFPGTPIWDYAKARGLVSEDMDWDTLGMHFSENHDRAVILSERLTRDEIYKLYLRFKKQYAKGIITEVLKKVLRNPLKIPGVFFYVLVKVLRGKPFFQSWV